MTLQEFMAWLDGFSAAIGDAPTPEQWATIKAKLADVVPLAYPPVNYPPTTVYPFGGYPSSAPAYTTCNAEFPQ